MDLFQIVEVSDISLNNAGNKVFADMTTIANKLEFKEIKIERKLSVRNYFDRFKRKLKCLLDWNICYRNIKENSVVLLQHPILLTHNKILKKLKYNKKVKYISVVIDIEELRTDVCSKYHKEEFETMLEISDVFIVHNEKMLNFFVMKGISKDKIINIETFDYLQENNNIVEFEKSLIFAGNLNTMKCGFIGQLNQIKNIEINLYGSDFDNNLLNSKNIKYHGSFPPDEITKNLNRGFGLVWDGDSVDTCSGYYGQYLKYNNPHKLSLYLSCGLPVVIWSQAAQARFVKKYNVGLCVESLKEAERIISNMNEKEYKNLQTSVDKIRPLLCSGYFGTKAINKALNLLKSK